jgi:hypothetical protein
MTISRHMLGGQSRKVCDDAEGIHSVMFRKWQYNHYHKARRGVRLEDTLSTSPIVGFSRRDDGIASERMNQLKANSYYYFGYCNTVLKFCGTGIYCVCLLSVHTNILLHANLGCKKRIMRSTLTRRFVVDGA